VDGLTGATTTAAAAAAVVLLRPPGCLGLTLGACAAPAAPSLYLGSGDFAPELRFTQLDKLETHSVALCELPCCGRRSASPKFWSRC
jgi:hypothetical protein